MTLYAQWTRTVGVADPETVKDIPSAQAKIDRKTGLSTMRFMWKLSVADGETVNNVGAYIIPWALFADDDMEPAYVRLNNVDLKDGDTFSADLTDIPATAQNTDIYAVPIINSEVPTDGISATVEISNING